jgi:glucose-1-phosphate thymidylyltransferase
MALLADSTGADGRSKLRAGASSDGARPAAVNNGVIA